MKNARTIGHPAILHASDNTLPIDHLYTEVIARTLARTLATYSARKKYDVQYKRPKNYLKNYLKRKECSSTWTAQALESHLNKKIPSRKRASL